MTAFGRLLRKLEQDHILRTKKQIEHHRTTITRKKMNSSTGKIIEYLFVNPKSNIFMRPHLLGFVTNQMRKAFNCVPCMQKPTHHKDIITL